MINNFNLLSSKNPYELHYNKDNLLDNIFNYKNMNILDLFDTFASICYCDFYSPRNEDDFNQIELNIGVTNPELFKKIKPDLERLITFMTNGETWNINFYKKNKQGINISNAQVSFEKKINSIVLLSGGLDALAGAAQELGNNVLFVTFKTNKVESNKATQSFKEILKLNPNSYHIIIPKLLFNRKKQSTQRTRSLIFLASTFLYADYYKINEVKIYENGIMSLNPTFSFRRRVTHTTHPRTLYIINTILKKLDINIKIVNPFNFLTKAEVIDLIPKSWNTLISNTKTCSKMPGSKVFHNRNKSGICQCGICTACILRQIGMVNSSKPKYDDHYILPLNISSLNSIIDYEKKYGQRLDKSLLISRYKYLEKQSLIQYYKEFKDKINSGEIYRYLELSPIFFTNNYKKEYNRMLLKFVQEIDKYINIQI